MNTLGKYQILGEIGKGPVGVTYRALDTSSNRELALKLLPSAGISAESKALFPGELTACAALRNPYVVSPVDFGEADGTVYIGSELLAGKDLRRYVAETAPLPLARKLRLVAQICEGLACAHRSKIAHGNIKPSNIFVTGDRNATILDLGIAKWNSPVSPNYLAPEQILAQSFDSRSDVFSVAVVLYELLAGMYPFQAPAGLIPREIVHAEPVPLRRLDPQIPDELERLVLRALEKHPEQRLQSADEFAVGLYAIALPIEGEPVARPAAAGAVDSGRPVESAVKRETPVKPVSSGRRALIYVASGVLGIFAIAALLSHQSSNASPAKIADPASKPVSALPVVKGPAVVTEKQTAPETPKVETRAERILRGQVSVMWEDGRYTQAMKLVDGILADDPSQAEARAWKKRIHAAQDAEAALK